jgi:hypothetical protein
MGPALAGGVPIGGLAPCSALQCRMDSAARTAPMRRAETTRRVGTAHRQPEPNHAQHRLRRSVGTCYA